MSPSPVAAPSYAGDLSPSEAWQLLSGDGRVWLVDVRTQAEWTFVGQPDLSLVGRQAILVSWQLFPDMTHNAAFLSQIEAEGPKPDDTLLLLCRSGVRSRAAAEFLTAQGYTACWNITDGFEGGPDQHGHRGGVAGWKASDLPWVQG